MTGKVALPEYNPPKSFVHSCSICVYHPEAFHLLLYSLHGNRGHQLYSVLAIAVTASESQPIMKSAEFPRVLVRKVNVPKELTQLNQLCSSNPHALH